MGYFNLRKQCFYISSIKFESLLVFFKPFYVYFILGIEDFPSSILPRREVDVVARREDGFDVIPREYSLAALPRPVHPNRLRKEMSQFVSQ